MNRITKYFKKLQVISLLVVTLLGLSSMLVQPQVSAAGIVFGGPFDKDSNAVLFGGAATTQTIVKDYKHGVSGTATDGTKVVDSAASIQHIYDYFKITRSDIDTIGHTAVAGSVDINGNVFVGKELVATDALTAGRTDIKGKQSKRVTHEGTTFWVRKPRVSFKEHSLTAFVVMQDGRFKYAILSSCGNSLSAHPKPAPKASLACTQLLLTPGTVETNGDTDYTFTAQATANNATIASYTFNLGKGHGTQTINSSAKKVTSKKQTYKPGTYNISVTVSGRASGSATTAPKPATCTKSFTVKPKQPKHPKNVEFTCDQLIPTKIGTSTTGDVTYTLTAETTTRNATIAKYLFDFGNGTTQPLNSSLTKVTSDQVTYKAGTSAKPFVTVFGKNTITGKDLKAGGPGTACATSISVPPNAPPVITTTSLVKALPNTGAGSVIGLFMGVSAAAGIGYRVWLRRRFSRGL